MSVVLLSLREVELSQGVTGLDAAGAMSERSRTGSTLCIAPTVGVELRRLRSEKIGRSVGSYS